MSGATTDVDLVTGEPLLRVTGVSKSFGGVRALSNVSLEVPRGEIRAVIGPNGAGKSTLINLISGNYRPDTGTVHFDGKPLARVPTHRVPALGISRTFQNVALFKELTVLENIMLGCHARSPSPLRALLTGRAATRLEAAFWARAEAALEFVEISHVRHERAGTLAWGLQKRVELARALAQEPQLLLLDEPMCGMTTAEKDDMVQFLMDANQDLGLAIILIEHDLGVVTAMASQMTVLNFGEKIAEGLPAQVTAHPEVIKAYFGTAPEAA